MRAPTLLCIGPASYTHDAVITLLQQELVHPGEVIHSCRCDQCTRIREERHEGVTWLTPTHEYTLADLEPLTSRICFQLDEGEKHYFVIPHGELLTRATANKLLKVLEEPPLGYYFVLLTENEAQLLPTIRSRALVVARADGDQSSTRSDELLAAVLPFFRQSGTPALAQFDTLIKEQRLTPHDTRALLDLIMITLVQEGATLPQRFHDTYKTLISLPPTQGNGHIALMTLLLSR